MTGRFVALTALSRLKTPPRSPWPNAVRESGLCVDVGEAVRAELSGVTERGELRALAPSQFDPPTCD
jgi:hypothetical protein